MCIDVIDQKLTKKLKKSKYWIEAWKLVKYNGTPLNFPGTQYKPGWNVAQTLKKGKYAPVPKNYEYIPSWIHPVTVLDLRTAGTAGIHAYLTNKPDAGDILTVWIHPDDILAAKWDEIAA